MYTRKYRVGINLDRYAKILVYSVAIGALLSAILTAIVLTIVYNEIHHNMVAQYESRINTKNAQIAELKETHQLELEQQAVEFEETISSLNDEITYWTDQYNAKVQELEQYTTTAQASFNQLKQYWYVLRESPKNSGITLELINFVDEQCKMWDINPHWMWHIYQIESTYTARKDNAQGSGARGLGQVMPSAGRSIWQNVLKKGTYDHTMAYDPFVNVEITTTLLGRNLAIGSMTNALQLYSGGGGSVYYNSVVNAAKTHGITLNDNNAHYPD